MKVWIRWNTVLGNSTTEGEFVEDAGEFYWREGICVKRFYLSLPSFWAVQTKSGHPLSCNYKCYIFNRSEDTLRVRKVLSRVRHSSNSFVCSLYETIVLAGKTQSLDILSSLVLLACKTPSRWCVYLRLHSHKSSGVFALITRCPHVKWRHFSMLCKRDRKKEINCVILSRYYWYLFHDVIQDLWTIGSAINSS